MLTRLLVAVNGRDASGTSLSVNRRIFGAALLIGVTTALVKLVSMVKELIVAGTFGRGDELDAFLIAFVLPSFAINVVGGSFNAALVPTFVDVRDNKGAADAQKLFSSVVVLSTFLLVIVAMVLAILAPFILPYLGSAFNPKKLVLTRNLFYVMLPIMIIKGLATTWGAVLGAAERFALISFAPAAIPLAIILTLVLVGGVWGIFAMAIGTLAGFILEAGILANGLKRHGLSLIPRWHGLDSSVKKVLGQYGPMIAAGVLMGSTELVDQSMAAALEPGSVSALSYGNKLVAFALGIGATGLGTAALPYLSQMVARRDWSGIRNTLKRYLCIIFLVTVPLVAVLIFFSEDLVRLIFERGAFLKHDTQLVGKVQARYLLQVPFYVCGIFLVRLISALKANHVLMWGTMISVVLNVTLNYLFMKWMGVAGIALSTSVVYFIAFLYMSIMAARLLSLNAQIDSNSAAQGR